MANHMKEVAEILGVKLDEEFEIVNKDESIVYAYGNNNIFKLSKKGLQSKNKTTGKWEGYTQNFFKLVYLLTGEFKVKKM